MKMWLINKSIVSLMLLLPFEHKKNFDLVGSNICKIAIVTPYNCIEEIEFSDKGKGVLKTGKSDENYGEKFSLDTVYSIDSFRISNNEQLGKINRQVKHLLKTKKLKSDPKNDAFHFIVFINGENKVDAYGGVDEVNKILRILIRYLPTKHDRCNVLRIFKK